MLTLIPSFFQYSFLPPDADGVGGVGGVGGLGELPEVTKRLQGADKGEGLVFGLDQAVHLSIDCACKLGYLVM